MVNQEADVCAAFLGDLFALLDKAVDRGAKDSQAVERPWKGLNRPWVKVGAGWTKKIPRTGRGGPDHRELGMGSESGFGRDRNVPLDL